MKKRYVVKLNEEERDRLRELVDKGTVAAYRRRHAQILLKADEADAARRGRIARLPKHLMSAGPRWSDCENVSSSTVWLRRWSDKSVAGSARECSMAPAKPAWLRWHAASRRKAARARR